MAASTDTVYRCTMFVYVGTLLHATASNALEVLLGKALGVNNGKVSCRHGRLEIDKLNGHEVT